MQRGAERVIRKAERIVLGLALKGLEAVAQGAATTNKAIDDLEKARVMDEVNRFRRVKGPADASLLTVYNFARIYPGEMKEIANTPITELGESALPWWQEPTSAIVNRIERNVIEPNAKRLQERVQRRKLSHTIAS